MRSLMFAVLVVFATVAVIGMVAMGNIAKPSLKVAQDPMRRERVGMLGLHVGRCAVCAVRL